MPGSHVGGVLPSAQTLAAEDVGWPGVWKLASMPERVPNDWVGNWGVMVGGGEVCVFAGGKLVEPRVDLVTVVWARVDGVRRVPVVGGDGVEPEAETRVAPVVSKLYLGMAEEEEETQRLDSTVVTGVGVVLWLTSGSSEVPLCVEWLGTVSVEASVEAVGPAEAAESVEASSARVESVSILEVTGLTVSAAL